MGTHPIFESDFDCLTEKMLHASARVMRLRRGAAVQLPKAKQFTEGELISALRSTVPRPTLALPWAQGTQHEHHFDYYRNEVGDDGSDLLKRKELGQKAAEHVLRQMKVEFDWDASKGEWGEHNQVHR